MDDPYHTDFLLGGGFSLNAMDDDDISNALFKRRFELLEGQMGATVDILCGSGVSIPLEVVHPKRNDECLPHKVAIIPNAGPSYVAAALTAGAVITEVGGAMAHLVAVSREKDVKIVRSPHAREDYPVGMMLVVDCDNGHITTHD